ncbi:Hypothetical protein CINCED_3A007398 [Cinara cedri]|uniref:Uncharacterized protein n=1 Tax=Cinara cedri TaxID=506608 RepID=A0A5E4MEW9_9HEMI|nr:Hypothetical protein CINCED_3A007398 [Cinara cedri]
MNTENKLCKDGNSKNNNDCQRPICKSKNSPDICDYLKSQPTPEWIKSIKQNVKTNTGSSSKTVKCPNEIKSTSEHAKPVINNVQNCKSVQKSTTESSSAVNKDVAGKSSCPCKGLGKFHNSRNKNNDTKLSGDRGAGWGLADWNLGNKKKEEMPKGQITASTSCKKDQTSTTDNVSKCKNVQKPVQCPSTTCKDENRNNELSKVVQKPEQVLNYKNDQKPATDNDFKCKNTQKSVQCSSPTCKHDNRNNELSKPVQKPEPVSTCKNVQKSTVGCPSVAGCNSSNKNPGISHNTDLSHGQHHVNKLLKPVTDNVSKCKNVQKPAECPSHSRKDDNLNVEITRGSGCADKKMPSLPTLCPCIRKPVKVFSWYRPKGQCPTFKPDSPCGCSCHSGSEVRRSRL